VNPQLQKLKKGQDRGDCSPSVLAAWCKLWILLLSDDYESPMSKEGLATTQLLSTQSGNTSQEPQGNLQDSSTLV